MGHHESSETIKKKTDTETGDHLHSLVYDNFSLNDDDNDDTLTKLYNKPKKKNIPYIHPPTTMTSQCK